MTSLAAQGWIDVAATVRGGDVARLRPHAAGGRLSQDEMDAVSQLTSGQRDCLRLVYRHMTSKDIARELGVSPHTVDMRIRTAMRTLSVTNRIDAARLVVEFEGAAYQPLIYQAPELADEPGDGSVEAPASTRSDENAIHTQHARIRSVVGPPAGGPPRPAGASPLFFTDQPQAASDQFRTEAPLVGSVPWGPRNDLSVAARLLWIFMIAIGSALGFGAILSALEALKHLV